MPRSRTAKTWLLALTTRDGKVVQEHFGHARHFHIVRVESSGTWAYVESRVCEPGCDGGIAHDDAHDARFAPIVELLSDCDAVITAQIGPGAAAYVLTHGLRVFEARGFVGDIMDEVVKALVSGGDSNEGDSEGREGDNGGDDREEGDNGGDDRHGN